LIEGYDINDHHPYTIKPSLIWFMQLIILSHIVYLWLIY